MSFKTASDIPFITRGDMHALNELFRRDGSDEKILRLSARPLDDLKAYHRRWMERRFIGEMKASHYAVLAAIVARTFSWNKPIEAIPLVVFTKGVMDPRNPEQHSLDKDGLPIFVGTGLNATTVRTALQWLADNHLIERFQILGSERTVHAYMPVSATTLFVATAGLVDYEAFPKSIWKPSVTSRLGGALEIEFQNHWYKPAAEAQHAA